MGGLCVERRIRRKLTKKKKGDGDKRYAEGCSRSRSLHFFYVVLASRSHFQTTFTVLYCLSLLLLLVYLILTCICIVCCFGC